MGVHSARALASDFRLGITKILPFFSSLGRKRKMRVLCCPQALPRPAQPKPTCYPYFLARLHPSSRTVAPVHHHHHHHHHHTKGERASAADNARLPPPTGARAPPRIPLARPPVPSPCPSASVEWRPAVTRPESSVSPSSPPAPLPSPSDARPRICPYATDAALRQVQSVADLFAGPVDPFPVRQPTARIESSPAGWRDFPVLNNMF
jgi:hypothetical protein